MTPIRHQKIKMRRSGFKRKATTPMKRTPLKKFSMSATALTKRSIQALLRTLVIQRDGGCILRHYPETGRCGGYRNDGELILQCEHLHTRSNSASFADDRLVVCLCLHHHLYYKPQHADEYYRIVKKHIGPERTKLLEAVQADRKAHKMDWNAEWLYLENQLMKLNKNK